MLQERVRNLADEAASVIIGSQSNLAWHRKACRCVAAVIAFLMVGVLVTACSDWFQAPPAPSPRPLPTPTSTLSLSPIRASTPAPELRLTATPPLTPLSTPASTSAPTPAPTAEDLLVAQLSEAIGWFGEPPDPIHLEAREKITSIWLRDAELGEFITQAPWVADGITEMELDALGALNILSAIDSELVESIFALPWVASGVDHSEFPAFGGLLEIGENNPELVSVLVPATWVVEGPELTEPLMADVLGSLLDISLKDPALALSVAEVPWVADGVNSTEAVILSVLPDYLTFNPSYRLGGREFLAQNQQLVDDAGNLIHVAPDVHVIDGLVHVFSRYFSRASLDRVVSQPWFRDGVDPLEAARAAILLTLIGESRFYEELRQGPLMPHRTISLPLAGEVRIWIVTMDGVSIPAEEMLAAIEESARISEDFVGAPFPTTDIIVEAADYGTDCRPSWGHISWSVYCDQEELAHGVAHYYFGEGNPEWLNEGAASLIQGYVNDALGVETLADRRTRLASDVARWADEKGIENLSQLRYYYDIDYQTHARYTHVLRLSPNQFGENLLHNLLDVMGQPAMSAALKELHIPAWGYFQTAEPREELSTSEEETFDTFLRHAQPEREEEVRDVYRRLHGGVFTIADVDLEDDHSDRHVNATKIDLGQVVEGVLDYPSDFDFFRFQPERGQKYRLKVNHETLGISAITLYSPIIRDSNTFGRGSLIPELWNWKARWQTPSGPQILWVAPSSERHYFVVENFGAKTGSYTLTISEIDDVKDDHGDSLSTATTISTGETVAGTVDTDFDFDFFRFEATEGRRYEIEVVPGTLQSFRTRLFTARNATPSNWNNLYPDNEAHGPGSYRVTWRAPDSGVYYLDVDGYNENLGTYTVRVTDLGDDS